VGSGSTSGAPAAAGVEPVGSVVGVPPEPVGCGGTAGAPPEPAGGEVVPSGLPPLPLGSTVVDGVLDDVGPVGGIGVVGEVEAVPGVLVADAVVVAPGVVVVSVGVGVVAFGVLALGALVVEVALRLALPSFASPELHAASTREANKPWIEALAVVMSGPSIEDCHSQNFEPTQVRSSAGSRQKNSGTRL
jgi:hypothetical protein